MRSHHMIKIALFTAVCLLCISCQKADNLPLSLKYHTDKYLVEKNVLSLSDGTWVDCYERNDLYYYLSNSDALLLVVNPVPPVWEYDEIIEKVSSDAQNVFKDEASGLTLYDLPSLLEQAYEDYNESKDIGEYQNHVLFIDATVSVDTSNIYCNYSLSYPGPGHFTGHLEGKESMYVFDKKTGKLVNKD